jgi:hypothetical protein
MMQIIKTALAPAKTAPAPIKPAPAPGKTVPSSSAMTLHTGKGAAWVSSFHTPELEGCRGNLETVAMGWLIEGARRW